MNSEKQKILIFFKLNSFSVMCLLLGIVLNIAGGFLSRVFSFPIWLNNVGTLLTAIQFGPIAGAVTAGISGAAAASAVQNLN